ncbi:MAG TPA: hypothetical protein VM661_12790 [Candidatus Sulfotelmatobacter sp.]|jgi:hypothetical protein|nr:hypothetical protein [Candidatus Sulfotelmatobacter sp.]
MSADGLVPVGAGPDLGWAAIMRWYVTGGYAANRGPFATAALVVLATAADLPTGDILGLGVDDIARLGGMGRTAAKAALASLEAAGWLDKLPGRRPGQRARYRLRYRAGLVIAGGGDVWEASWPHVPITASRDREAVRESVETGAQPRPGIEIKILQNIVINQHIEAGGVGIVDIESASNLACEQKAGRVATQAGSPRDPSRARDTEIQDLLRSSSSQTLLPSAGGDELKGLENVSSELRNRKIAGRKWK